MTHRLPDFVIVGAMKCGTSSLHEQLARLPGVFMSTPKEPNFFSDDSNWSRGFEWYASCFAGAPGDAIVGESSTHYTKLPDHPRVVERLKEHLPGARFVYVMRHPIDRLASHVIHGWSERRMSGDAERDVARHTELVDYGLYAMQMRPYIEAFGPEHVLPVFLERMRSHPREELERVARFVGVSGEITCAEDAIEQNVSGERLRKGTLLDFIMEAPVVSHARRALVPRAAREWVKDRFYRMRTRPELVAGTRSRLEARFDEDLAELSAMLGLDSPLTCANFASIVTGIESPAFVSREAASR